MKRKIGDTVTVPVPEPIARQLQRRYQPCVARSLDLAKHTLSVESLLLSVYLQGVLDGAEVRRRNPSLGEE